ncbi:SRPBCC family protein [Aeromicrobium sp.]|uniref:SRPBCC family protein n=1 Tax=Aeromicrobium sp. TaxID=1871063 RepID=UPI003D6BA297
MPERVAPLEASIHIDAPPARVWAIVSDQRRMNEWSPEIWRQRFFGDEIGAGTRSININKRKGFFWPTASKITEFVPEKRLAFYVTGSSTFWSYDLAPEGDGTLVIERRDLKGGRRAILSKATAALALGGIDEHDVELFAGMEETLARIKAEAER